MTRSRFNFTFFFIKRSFVEGEEAARLVGGLEIDFQIVMSWGGLVDQATGLPTFINR